MCGKNTRNNSNTSDLSKCKLLKYIERMDQTKEDGKSCPIAKYVQVRIKSTI